MLECYQGRGTIYTLFTIWSFHWFYDSCHIFRKYFPVLRIWRKQGNPKNMANNSSFKSSIINILFWKCWVFVKIIAFNFIYFDEVTEFYPCNAINWYILCNADPVVKTNRIESIYKLIVNHALQTKSFCLLSKWYFFLYKKNPLNWKFILKKGQCILPLVRIIKIPE